MPRRPSGSVLHALSSPNRAQAQKPTETRPAFATTSTTTHNTSTPTLGPPSPPATPQQKVVHALVNRLKNKLPCHSGYPLDRVETSSSILQTIETLVELSRESSDMIVWALTELLDRLAKQADSNTGHLSIEVLQSQLFILKVLSIVMASRWSQNSASEARAEAFSNGNHHDVKPHPPSIYSSESLWQEPAPFDDACVKYILSVMVLFMRQTSTSDAPLMLQTRSTDLSFRDFEDDLVVTPPPPEHPLPDVANTLRTRPSMNSVTSERVHLKAYIPIAATNKDYEKTHMSLVKSTMSVNTLIARYVGRVVFHISASNWSVVRDRLSSKISYLAAHPESQADTVDLQLMAHSLMDRVRLVNLLHQLSSLLVNMRKESQIAVATFLRSAVWNWIDLFPHEFNEAIRMRGKLEGAPERVYDLLNSKIPPGQERVYWPTLSILLCCTTEKIRAELVNVAPVTMGRRELKFGDNIVKNISSGSRLADVALTCAIDICRAAAYVDPGLGEIILPDIAADMAHEIKGALNYTSNTRRLFWETHDDIDVAMYSESLVALFRFLAPEDSIPPFRACMEHERSEAVKTCAVRASLTLVEDELRFRWQRKFSSLGSTIGPKCRAILRAIGVRRLDSDNNKTKRIASRPKARRLYAEPLSDREVLVLGVLSMWRRDPGIFMIGLHTLEDHIDWVNGAAKLWEAPFDIAVKMSIASTMQKVSAETFMTPPVGDQAVMMLKVVKQSLPVTLLSIVANLLSTRTDLETQKLWIDVAQQVLGTYCLKTDIPHIKEVQSNPERLAPFTLAEVSFLVALTSSDNGISELAAKGLRLISHAERFPDSPVNPYISDEDKSKRNPIYEQLGSVTVAGRVNHQRRVRRLIRMLTFSAGIQVVVWQECYNRWRVLDDKINALFVVGPGPENPMQQESRFQWQNLTLYLAALSGVCYGEDVQAFSLDKIVPREMVPDKLRVIENPRANIERFLDTLTGHLMASENTIRDFVREALGSELGPRLYTRLLDVLKTQVNALDGKEEDVVVSMMEQVVSTVKLMAENTQVALEEVVNVDIGPVMLAMARRIARCYGAPGQRLRIKYCNLCESIGCRSDNISLRIDGATRHEILDFTLHWMALPKEPQKDPVATSDLGMSCLRATVKLLDRLELRSDSQGDEEGNAVSRLFNKYSTALLGCIGVCQTESTTPEASDTGLISPQLQTSSKTAELHDLVIIGLTHLVGANSESGFKQCLPLAYDQDNRKRTIFAHVFARVIGQGTVFNHKDKSVLKARFQALYELVRGSDLILPLIVCEICPANDVEIMISVLLNVFNTRSSLLCVVKRMIEREVSQTSNEIGLFRTNSTFMRFLSAFGRLHGYNYLRSLVQPLVNTMSAMPPGTSYDIDPNSAIGQDIAANQRSLEYVASSFIKLMSTSLPALPGMFRDIGAHIAKVVSEVWPESKYAAMGAFIFLRFISPAVVAPEIVDVEVPKNENTSIVRHGLKIIAKIIQNLANNIFFGKEPHMTPLNKFLESNITTVTRFLSELHKYGGAPDDINDNWTGTTSDETDVIVLHRFFQKHADRIGKELLSHSSGIDVGGSIVTGKQIWDNFCALLVDLGPPLEVPRLSSLNSSTHREYLEFMSKYANRSTTLVEHIFMETVIKEENTAVFVLRLSVIDVEGLDIELLMYHIFKILTSETYRSRSFDLILDCTSFNSNSEIPLQWLKYCAELIPCDIRERFSVARILNPNTLMQKFMRRLYNISAGIPFCEEIKIYTSVLQLMEDVRSTALPPLGHPVSLEQEAHESFSDVTMRTAARVPVVLRVGSTHIRVTSIKSLPISPGLSCQSTELIPLTDVSDIYNVSTGHDQHEFIIRRRQGVTVYFSSPSRELIVKTIRSTKGRLKETQAPLTERFSRFSNVPATLLHIGFLSIDLSDEELRGAAYKLLAAVCDYLKYEKNPIVAPNAGFIPGDPTAFVAQLSEKLAEFAPQLTLDFIHEVSAAMTSMDKSEIANRISCLSYMSPWIQNLSHFANATHVLYERSGARLRDCIRTLADLSLTFPEITSTIQKEVWSEVSKLDATTIEIVLDELIRTATDGVVGTRRCESISHIIATLSSMNVRARIYTKLRKALSKVPPKFTKTLTEHPNWSEISTLIRLTHIVGSQSTQPGQSYTFVPEVVHLVSLVAGEGPTLVRKSAYGTIINLLQSLYAARPEDGESEIKQLISDYSLPENLKLFGLHRETPTSEYVSLGPSDEKKALDTHENLVQLLIRVLDVSAGSQGLLNVWRARWMSLVTSTAFQQSPAVQIRSFVVLAALAVRHVDDDFLYQILVAFRTALAKANETNTIVIVSMLRCLCRIVPAIAQTSRYVCSLFWLAVALLQVSHLSLYVEATWLLTVTLEYMEKHDIFKTNSVETVLLEAREQIDEVMSQLDDILRISFVRSFSYSLSSVIFKGMRHTALKESAESALRTLLRITSRAYPTDSPIDQRFSPVPETLAYFIALLPVSTNRKSFKQLLDDSNVEDQSFDAVPDGVEVDESTPRINAAILGIEDSQQALLAASFIGTMLTTAQGDDAETEILYGLLSSLALSYPDTVTMIYDSLQDRIKDAFSNTSNPKIIRSVSSIFKMTLQDPSKFTLVTHLESNTTLNSVDEASVGPSRSHLEALDRLDMQGLANSFQFLPPNRGHATRMINWIPGIVNLMINL